MPNLAPLEVAVGKTYQTRNNRRVVLTGVSPHGFMGLLKPLLDTGEGEQYIWRTDGGYNTGNDTQIGIPHDLDLLIAVQ